MNQLDKSLERYTNRDHESMKICQSPIDYLKMYKKNMGSKAFPCFQSGKKAFNLLLEDIKNLYILGASNSNKDIEVYKSISRAELDMLMHGKTSVNYFLSTSSSKESVVEYAGDRHIIRIVRFNVNGVNNIEATKQNAFLIAPEEEEVILIPPFEIKNFRESREKIDPKTGQKIIYYEADIEKQNQIQIPFWKLKDDRTKAYLNVLEGVEKFGAMINSYLKGTETDEIFQNSEYLKWASELQRLMMLEKMLVETQIGIERQI